MARQEQYFSETRKYTTAVVDLDYTASGNPSEFETESGNYVISLGKPTSTLSVAVATAVGSQKEDAIQQFRIYSNGRKEHSLETGGAFISGWDD